MSELHFIVEEAPEGGFIARAVVMDIFTEADDLPALHAQVRDAVHCHFEDALYSLDNIALLISRAWIETCGSGRPAPDWMALVCRK